MPPEVIERVLDGSRHERDPAGELDRVEEPRLFLGEFADGGFDFDGREAALVPPDEVATPRICDAVADVLAWGVLVLSAVIPEQHAPRLREGELDLAHEGGFGHLALHPLDYIGVRDCQVRLVMPPAV